MDYGTLKKLAVSMGEEFQIIDAVTLEAINIQRLITKEREYCTNLESLIKSCDAEIDSLESETTSMKCKLGEVKNRVLLIHTSLESLKSSHTMVELLKGDLVKQLQLEMIKTSEQDIKFESTLNKYEEMWKNYKAIYQKFPLVSDLKKMQSKIKLENIILSALEKEVKDYKNKIEEFYCIKGKREKIILLSIAEKYITRKNQTSEKDNLEKSIRLKRENLIVETEDTQNACFSSSASESMMESKLDIDGHISNTLSRLMDDFITELSKDNISNDFLKKSDKPQGSYQHYESILNSGAQSVPVLKIPPLPLFDSPPRKIRSIGSLLSPPKEWSKECSYKTDSKHTLTAEVTKESSSPIELEENGSDPPDTMAMDADPPVSEDLPSNEILGTSEIGITLANDVAPEMEVETQDPEKMENSEENNTSCRGFERTQAEKEETKDSSASKKYDHVSATYHNDENIKPTFSSETPEFTYTPRINKPTKAVQDSHPKSTSPYFDGSFMDFMEVPQKSSTLAKKEPPLKPINETEVRESKEVVAVTDERVGSILEEKKDFNDKSSSFSNDARDGNVHAVILDQPGVKHGFPMSHDAGMDVDCAADHKEKESNYSSTSDKMYDVMVEKTESSSKSHGEPTYPSSNDANQLDISQSHHDLNMSFGSPMNYSQASYADSMEYPENYHSFSPGAESMDESAQFIPSPMDQGHVSIFGSQPNEPSFNYGFSAAPQQSSVSSLFGNMNSGDSGDKERKQSEVFNFSFDTKTKTPTMFKLF